MVCELPPAPIVELALPEVREIPTGGFSATSINLHLEDNRYLRADCLTSDGVTYKPASLNLEKCIGNHNGFFVISFGGWNLSADKASLTGAVLSALLRTETGNWLDASIDLDTCITNVDGVLRFGAL